MKVITVKQPWASLIVYGWGKDIENRDWKLPQAMIRQRVGIHSSKRLDPAEAEAAQRLIEDNGIALPEGDYYADPFFYSDLARFPLGCVLGTVLISDCVRYSKSPWFIGEYGFVLADPQPFKDPIPAKGALGFWEWEPPRTCMCFAGIQATKIINPADPKGPLIRQECPCPICRPKDFAAWCKRPTRTYDSASVPAPQAPAPGEFTIKPHPEGWAWVPEATFIEIASKQSSRSRQGRSP